MALSIFNKTLMIQMKLVNKLQEGQIAVVFVNYGTGGISAVLRSEGALFNEIPPTIFEPNVEMFAAIQDFFGLKKHHAQTKRRYIDYLHDDSSLNYMVFKPRNGRNVTKRPSQFHKKWPGSEYSAAEQERYLCFSESIDINSNFADFIVVKNDPVFPVMDYLVALEGSPHMISHFNHVGNLIPQWYQRQMFDKVKSLYYKK